MFRVITLFCSFFFLLEPSNCLAAKVKGLVVNYGGKHGSSEYIPPMGKIRCKSLDVISSRYISEKYTKYGGVMDIWNAGFTYRLDMHLINTKQNHLEFDYKKYFHKEGLPHLLKDFPKGKLVDESVQETDKKRVYFAAIYYPRHRGGFKSAFEMIDSRYRVVILFVDNGVLYTTSKYWPGTYGQDLVGDYDSNKKIIISEAIQTFHQCKYGKEAEYNKPQKQILPSTLSIRIIDSLNAIKNLFRYVEWNNEQYSPESFITTIKNTNVNRIYLLDSNSDKGKEQCIAYIAKKAKVKAFSLSKDKEINEITQKPKSKSCILKN